MKLNGILVSLCLIWTMSGIAQETVLSSGGDGTGSGGSISYSIGQIAYLSAEDPPYSLTEGVQQVFDTSTGIEELEASVKIFPNPVQDFLQIRLQDLQGGNESYRYVLYDMHGKILQAARLLLPRHSLDIAELSQGMYHLSIRDKNNRISSFQFLKQ